MKRAMLTYSKKLHWAVIKNLKTPEEFALLKMKKKSPEITRR